MSDGIDTTNLSSAQKRALLAQLLQQKAERAKTTAPLSSAQRALWFLYEMAPDATAFNIMCALRIRSSVDIPALRRSFQALIDRHPALRTTYGMQQGVAVQQVHAHQELFFELIDAVEWSEAELDQRISAVADHPFDLEHGPMMRVYLFTRPASEYILLWVVHHIAVDLWSFDILMDELRALYIAEQTKTPAALPKLALQYTDYVRWQNDMLASPRGEQLWDYWKRQLSGDLPILNLPTDHSRPPVQTYRGTSQAFNLDGKLVQQLKDLAKAERTTLYTTVLAAFLAMLSRYSGQEELLIGTPLAGRSHADLERLVGCFVNHVVLRMHLAGDPSFRTLIGRTRDAVLSAVDYQDYPFNMLVERLQPPRDPSRSPLFQVVFIWDKLRLVDDGVASPFLPKGLEEPAAQMDWQGLSMVPFAMEQRGAAFDLTLIMFEGGSSLAGTFIYNTDLFDATTIMRMVGHFQTVLAHAVAAPECPVSKLPLLTEVERYQQLVEWNDLRVYEEQCLHTLFEACVALTPEAVALSFDGQQISYSELNERSNRLAHALLRLGLSPRQPVVLMLEYGPWQIAALLGILKAGGMFVCLDARYPLGRIEHMLEEAHPALVISDASCLQQHHQLFAAAQARTAGRIVVVDMTDEQLKANAWDNDYYGVDYLLAQPTINPDVTVDPRDPAYIAYTSGSTGKPKGIVQSHRNFCQFIGWQSRQFQIRAPQRVAQWASITYDASYCEIFGTLCFGATLCLAPAAIKYDPSAALAWVRNERISLLQVVPSFCRQLLNVIEETSLAGSDPCPTLEWMLLAGEVLPVDLAAAWLKRFPQRPQLYNLYGPTETVLATYAPVREVRPGQRSIPVGRAIDGRQILILDRGGQLCPIGVRGEIFIRSPYLMIGYFQRPEETARVLIQNPLHEDDPELLYRTGDLGCWRPDGSIEFFGRIDHQVKIRGMRVELAEIEASLLTHPHVHECVVVAQDYQAGDPRLVAYVVSKALQNAEPSAPSAAVLRTFLKEQLPDHMVPSFYVFLPDLPRTPNGKVDRKALPKPDDLRPDLATHYVAPQTATETTIAELWQTLLRVDRVGVLDNFFDLGGHSLLATQAVNKLRELFGVDISLRNFFETPTIAKLAQRIDADRSELQSDVAAIAELLGAVQQLSDEDVRDLLGSN